MAIEKKHQTESDIQTSHSESEKDLIDGDSLFSKEIETTGPESFELETLNFDDNVTKINDDHPNKEKLDKLKAQVSAGHYELDDIKIEKVASAMIDEIELSFGLNS